MTWWNTPCWGILHVFRLRTLQLRSNCVPFAGVSLHIQAWDHGALASKLDRLFYKREMRQTHAVRRGCSAQFDPGSLAWVHSWDLLLLTAFNVIRVRSVGSVTPTVWHHQQYNTINLWYHQQYDTINSKTPSTYDTINSMTPSTVWHHQHMIPSKVWHHQQYNTINIWHHQQCDAINSIRLD